MKRFIAKSSILSLILIFIGSITWVAPGNYPYDLAAIINKLRLLESNKPPRIIILGGSSTLSINCTRMTKELGYPVVNLGLWGGLSIERYLEKLRPRLLSDDIMIVSQEYATLINPEYMEYVDDNDQAKKAFFLADPVGESQKYIRHGQFWELFTIFFDLLQQKSISYISHLVTLNFDKLFFPGFPKYHEDYNECGSPVKPFAVIRPLEESGTELTFPKREDCIHLQEFHRFCRQRGIRFLFSYQPYPVPEYNANRQQIQALHSMLKNKLNIPLLNRPEDNVYPIKNFADSINHLQPEYETIRTGKLIQNLNTLVLRQEGGKVHADCAR